MEIMIKNQIVLIDEQDAHFINLYKWNIQKKDNGYYIVYNVTTKEGKTVRFWLHRVILGVQGKNWKESIVDHINGNTLDNRRCNLRIVTPMENSYNSKKFKNNTTRYKGVDWRKQEKRYRVRISVNKKRITIGWFDDPIEAAKAYDDAAKKYHGEYAKLNFPD